MRRAIRTLLSSIFCLLLVVTLCPGQTPTTGQIAGQIVDPSEAAVPGAQDADVDFSWHAFPSPEGEIQLSDGTVEHLALSSRLEAPE